MAEELSVRSEAALHLRPADATRSNALPFGETALSIMA